MWYLRRQWRNKGVAGESTEALQAVTTVTALWELLLSAQEHIQI
jgi:hypothetical protein